MPPANAPKLYAAEKKFLEARGIDVSADNDVSSSGGTNSAEVLAAIAELRSVLDARLPDQSEEAVEERTNAAEAQLKAEEDRALELRNEIRALSRAIQETKAEIAALGLGGNSKLETASHELDAVVQATESATNDILGATERIDEIAQKLQLNAGDESERLAAEEIMECTIKCLEACNFQDITGQRISKVVNALKFIEQRIDSMIDIWGKEEIDEVDPSIEGAEDPDADLLNGPALEGEGISQDDIDALFD